MKDEETGMTTKKRNPKAVRSTKKDLPPRRAEGVRGGRDAASGLPTGKRTY
jgi:hypothetical protein